jgi:hydroxymethylbilane synthase
LNDAPGPGSIVLKGSVLTPDGSEAYDGQVEGRPEKAISLGMALADELLARAGPGFLKRAGI